MKSRDEEAGLGPNAHLTTPKAELVQAWNAALPTVDEIGGAKKELAATQARLVAALELNEQLKEAAKGFLAIVTNVACGVVQLEAPQLSALAAKLVANAHQGA